MKLIDNRVLFYVQEFHGLSWRVVRLQASNQSIGSLQQYVSDTISAEDMGPSKYTVEQVHKIGLFDIRIFNLDRHAGNMLVNSKTEMYPLTTRCVFLLLIVWAKRNLDGLGGHKLKFPSV